MEGWSLCSLVQHLVAQLEMAVREQLRNVSDPMQVLVDAVQLGEQQALKAQLAETLHGDLGKARERAARGAKDFGQRKTAA